MRLKIKKKKFELKEGNLFYLLASILAFVALLSASLLDYINFQHKKIYYLPWPEKKISSEAYSKKKPPETKKPELDLSKFLSQKLKEEGVAQENLFEERTEDGLIYFSIKTTPAEYKKLKDHIFSALKKQKIKIKLTERKTSNGEIIASVELQQKARLSGWLVFHLKPEEIAGSITPPATSPVTEIKEHLPEVAVVIDDMGEDMNFIQELVNLKVPLTIAILPESSHARETAELAEKNGLEVIIHLPLEALNSQITSAGAEGLIRTSMSREEITAILERDLTLVPNARGLNNHMGSKATADEQLMEIIISFLKEKNLYFLDSKTTPRSIAFDLAIKKKVPAASRQVFLDADKDHNKIKDRLFELFSSARKNGKSIAIGHPFPETLENLRTYLPRASEYGVKLVPVSALLQH
ncbi:MAG: divergent polysaccharide deacetylase family protein [Candidatus Aminicenantes bacterium]|jgi:polysaccharide deacetylase 2 family uncharacterized protein YibQ|nr:divergent polysaccharide deacetylase family protein [Candidatus Aminicenantes bacterium]